MSQKYTGSFNLSEVVGNRWRGKGIILKTAADCDPGVRQGSGLGSSTGNALRDAGILEGYQRQNRYAARQFIFYILFIILCNRNEFSAAITFFFTKCL